MIDYSSITHCPFCEIRLIKSREDRYFYCENRNCYVSYNGGGFGTKICFYNNETLYLWLEKDIWIGINENKFHIRHVKVEDMIPYNMKINSENLIEASWILYEKWKKLAVLQ